MSLSIVADLSTDATPGPIERFESNGAEASTSAPSRPRLRRLNGVWTRQGRVVVEGPRGTGAAESHEHQQSRDSEALHFVTPFSDLRCDKDGLQGRCPTSGSRSHASIVSKSV